jgi:hypothetical protein
MKDEILKSERPYQALERIQQITCLVKRPDLAFLLSQFEGGEGLGSGTHQG